MKDSTRASPSPWSEGVGGFQLRLQPNFSTTPAVGRDKTNSSTLNACPDSGCVTESANDPPVSDSRHAVQHDVQGGRALPTLLSRYAYIGGDLAARCARCLPVYRCADGRYCPTDRPRSATGRRPHHIGWRARLAPAGPLACAPAADRLVSALDRAPTGALRARRSMVPSAHSPSASWWCATPAGDGAMRRSSAPT